MELLLKFFSFCSIRRDLGPIFTASCLVLFLVFFLFTSLEMETANNSFSELASLLSPEANRKSKNGDPKLAGFPRTYNTDPPVPRFISSGGAILTVTPRVDCYGRCTCTH